MENGIDFLNWLYHDMSIKILTCLEVISDLVRVSCVSRSWRHYVIENGLCKQMCLRMFPQLSRVDHVLESSCGVKEPAEVGSSNFMEWQSLEREHRAYAFLAQGFTTFPIRELIFEPICASSTDNYPEESIHNTLEPRDRVARRSSYWSRKDKAIQQCLKHCCISWLVICVLLLKSTYNLSKRGLPLYSAKAVRFRMGHLKSPWDSPMVESWGNSTDDKVVWTYTSQEFRMAQENCLQKFKLPEPVLCIGGFLQIELLGRVQRQEIDGLFYICVSHVQIMGRSLSPAFGVEILEHSEKFALKVQSYTQPNVAEEPPAIASLYLQRRVRDLGQIINILRGNVVDVAEYELGVDDGESDDEFVL